jgi:hypothetical protein
MNPDHHSEFLECLENIRYLNTYNLVSCFTIAGCLAIAKTKQGDFQTGHEIQRR